LNYFFFFLFFLSYNISFPFIFLNCLSSILISPSIFPNYISLLVSQNHLFSFPFHRSFLFLLVSQKSLSFCFSDLFSSFSSLKLSIFISACRIIFFLSIPKDSLYPFLPFMSLGDGDISFPFSFTKQALLLWVSQNFKIQYCLWELLCTFPLFLSNVSHPIR